MTGPNTILNRAVEAFYSELEQYFAAPHAGRRPSIEDALAKLERDHPGLMSRAEAYEAFKVAEDAVVLASTNDLAAHRASPPDPTITENRNTDPLIGINDFLKKCGEATAGVTLGKFTVENPLLGKGGFGITLIVNKTPLNSKVVLKIPRGPTTVSVLRKWNNLLSEARILAVLGRKPGIVLVFDAACPEPDKTLSDDVWLAQFAATLKDDPRLWIEMEYVEGESLAERLVREPDNRLAPKEATCIMAEVADALAILHAKNILHRDLKPANIMLDKDDKPVLIDFGLAVQYDQQSDGESAGTRLYMSPRQLAGKKVEPRDEIWTLGVILYQLLTGKLPFAESDLIRDQCQSARQHGENGRFDVPDVLSKICDQCFEKQKKYQFSTAATFAAALRSWRTAPKGSGRRAKKLSDAEFNRITELARERLARRAQQVLDEQCEPGKFPFDLSPLAVEPDGAKRERRQPKPDPLSKEQARALVLGQTLADESADQTSRRWLRADSGMGKSTLLVYAEQQIASGTAEPLRLPLRLGAGPLPDDLRLPLLSDFDWSKESDAVLKLLDDKVLSPIMYDVNATERLAWFRRLVQSGRVVFLLDALDQTKKELEGLGTFFNSADLKNCPVLLTGRPEAEQDHTGVFRSGGWRTVYVLPFQEEQQRDYLGPMADVLLKKPDSRTQEEIIEALARGESQHDPKDSWQPLLGVPLLLRLMKQLALDKQLNGLTTRESIYDRALSHLIKKGLDTLKDKTRNAPDPTDLGDVLERIAWDIVLAAGPEGRVTGPAYLKIKWQYESKLSALAQVNTLTWILDPEGKIEWRHRSYGEYFAGVHLAKTLAEEDRRRMIQQHARDPDWRWVLRFALAFAHRSHHAPRDEPAAKDAAIKKAHSAGRDGYIELATDLIRYGNPFLVYDAIEHEGLRLPDELDRLCRWLVHRDLEWNWEALNQSRHYYRAWRAGDEPPKLTVETLDILEDLFRRDYRESRCLHPAWELLKGGGDPAVPSAETTIEPQDDTTVECETDTQALAARAQRIADEFLAAFPNLLRNGSDERVVANALKNSFERCPLDPAMDNVPYWRGSPEGVGEDDEHPQHQVIVTSFGLMRCLITNRQYELFDPGHHRLRDRFSLDDDQPVVWVNWYMATMFCIWLGKDYRLPTEAEWEYACRAGTDTAFSFGPELTAEQANFDFKVGATTPAGAYPANAWGLYDMHGNAWEWCSDWYAEDAYNEYQDQVAVDPAGPPTGKGRVLRGGGWGFKASLARAACRFGFTPVVRYFFVGFRVLCSRSART